MCFLSGSPLAKDNAVANVTGEFDEPTKVLVVVGFAYTKSQSGALTFTTQVVVVVLQGPPLSSVVRVMVYEPVVLKVILVDDAVGVLIVGPAGLTDQVYEPFPMALTAGGRVAAKFWVEPMLMLLPQALLIIGGEYGK